jgi:hypothetical protein
MPVGAVCQINVFHSGPWHRPCSLGSPAGLWAIPEHALPRWTPYTLQQLRALSGPRSSVAAYCGVLADNHAAPTAI